MKTSIPRCWSQERVIAMIHQSACNIVKLTLDCDRLGEDAAQLLTSVPLLEYLNVSLWRVEEETHLLEAWLHLLSIAEDAVPLYVPGIRNIDICGVLLEFRENMGTLLASFVKTRCIPIALVDFKMTITFTVAYVAIQTASKWPIRCFSFTLVVFGCLSWTTIRMNLFTHWFEFALLFDHFE